jgi:hypothetical protein
LLRDKRETLTGVLLGLVKMAHVRRSKMHFYFLFRSGMNLYQLLVVGHCHTETKAFHDLLKMLRRKFIVTVAKRDAVF